MVYIHAIAKRKTRYSSFLFRSKSSIFDLKTQFLLLSMRSTYEGKNKAFDVLVGTISKVFIGASPQTPNFQHHLEGESVRRKCKKVDVNSK